MAKKTTTKSKPKSAKKTAPKPEPIPEIWKCKVDWCNYKKQHYIRDQEVMISPHADSANDASLNRYFEKVAVKVDTIISEPVELAEGE